MKYLLGCSIVLFMVQNILAQQITCSPADKQAVEDKIIEIDGLLDNDFGKQWSPSGKLFWVRPMSPKPLR